MFSVCQEKVFYRHSMVCIVWSAIRTIICRQEVGAAMMADAYGKLTHRPGCVLSAVGLGRVTRQ